MRPRGWWHGLLAGALLSAVALGGALYIVTLQLEIRRLEQSCPVEAGPQAPPEYLPHRRPLGPAEA